MRGPSVLSPTKSRAGHLVYPLCERGELRPRGLLSCMAECDFCACAFDSGIVGTLKQIVALPDALRNHPCKEGGHPEMGHLPDRVFHCPARRSETLAISIPGSRGMSVATSFFALALILARAQERKEGESE